MKYFFGVCIIYFWCALGVKWYQQANEWQWPVGFSLSSSSTIKSEYDPDEFEIVRKNKGTQFLPYNRITQFQTYSTASYRDMRKFYQLDNR